jgi:hypothetical protein
MVVQPIIFCVGKNLIAVIGKIVEKNGTWRPGNGIGTSIFSIGASDAKRTLGLIFKPRTSCPEI